MAVSILGSGVIPVVGVRVFTAIPDNTDGGVVIIAGDINNYIVTSTGEGDRVQGEVNATFDGTTLVLVGNQTTSGTATIGSTLGVTGNTTVGGTLGITGATTLSSTLDTIGAATLSSTLGVYGSTSLDDTLDVTGAVSFEDDLTISGALDVNGTTTLGSISSYANNTAAKAGGLTDGDVYMIAATGALMVVYT